MTKNKIYIVEGKRDKELLKTINQDLFILTTNGYGFDEKFINKLVELEKNNEIVLILDPDFPGQKIRDKLSNELSNPIHIYIPKKLAIDEHKNKVGLEHVDIKEMKKLLSNEIIFTTKTQSMITTTDLFDLQLTGHENSKKLRDIVTSHYNLPKSNTKRLLEYLNKLGVTPEELREVLNES